MAFRLFILLMVSTMINIINVDHCRILLNVLDLKIAIVNSVDLTKYLHTDKCFIMCFCKKDKPIEFNFTMGTEVILKNGRVNDLGIVLQLQLYYNCITITFHI